MYCHFTRKELVFITEVAEFLVADRLFKLDCTSILFRNGEGRKWSKMFRLLFLYFLKDTKLFMRASCHAFFVLETMEKGKATR